MNQVPSRQNTFGKKFRRQTSEVNKQVATFRQEVFDGSWRGLFPSPINQINDARTWPLAGWPRVSSRGQAGLADASVRSRYHGRETYSLVYQYISPGSDGHRRCRSTLTSRYRSNLEVHQVASPDDNLAVPTKIDTIPAVIVKVEFYTKK